MKKYLFIDRDGTLIKEPPVDYQVDSLAKLEFMPGVFFYLKNIINLLDYKLVIVSNQDGLGTSSFPEDDFWPPHNMMLKAFENEGIIFDDILIDKSFPEENSPNRKPRTGMFSNYIGNSEIDLSSSIVIGDRITDIELAKNLGAKGILIGEDEKLLEINQNNLNDFLLGIMSNWKEIFEFLVKENRTSEISRVTHETNISVNLNLDGSGKCNISTGLGFFDHMLEQIGKHSGADLTIIVKGDLQVDEHHTIEDTALALGQAFYEALGSKRGIERYGYALPMDESYAQVLIDFGGRPWIVWETEFKREKVGDMPTEMFFHFFKSFSDASKCNLNIKAEGDNEHHKIEGIFKAFARAIKMAIKKDPFNFDLPTTKGAL